MITAETLLQQQPVHGISGGCASILRVLLYYDLFDYPLTAHEISLFLDRADIGIDTVNKKLSSLALKGIIDSEKGYWFLGDHNAQIVHKRLRMEAEGRRMWKIAQRFARLMRLIPYVRGVFISGQLSRYIADQKSDIDYFIVTEPERLWIVRTLFVLFRRTFLLNNRKYFCTNYYVTTENLRIRERNIYAACETASLKPLWNNALFNEFTLKNQDWVQSFYPNFDYKLIERRELITERQSLVQRCIETLLPKSLASRLDTRLLRTTRQFWQKKFPDRTKHFYQTALLCSPCESRAHPDDLSAEVLRRYQASLKRFGIDSLHG